MLSDIEIAQAHQMRPIAEVAEEFGITHDELEPYGHYMAKIKLSLLDRLADRPNGRYIDVTAITPTKFGEGKTVTTVGLGQALRHVGKSVVTCIRQPSLGPVFGIKGGAAGGGYSQVVPMEEFNLHLTGDVHAVSMANNLLAAYIENHLHWGNELGIDPYSITFRRVVDLNDRFLRNIVIGLGPKGDGHTPRETGFDITVASEVMAVLAMSSDLKDMRRRLGAITIGTTEDGKPVTAEQMRCAGAMTVLMKDAIKPNLLQNLEGGPVLVHAGPFANIAQGNNSIIADKIALKLADYVVTESGFAADMGSEKFMNIKCRASGLTPDCVVIVATVKALKVHSTDFGPDPSRDELDVENVGAVAKGCVNLDRHVRNMKGFGVPVVVVVNTFPTDTEAEHAVIRERALAEAVVKACEMPKKFRFTYPDDASIKEKIEAIATGIYGADGVDYLPAAEEKVKLYTSMGLDKLPICMAKTHLSLTHDPTVKGAPTGWRLPIRDIKASTGAGFLYPLCGEMRTMPGLGRKPAGFEVDIDENGKIVGLF